MKLSPKLQKSMERFLESPLRSAWLRTPQLDVYVRKGYHIVNGQMYRLIDIANITVQEKYQSQGLFKQTLDLFKQLCEDTTFQGVYVENVLNPMLGEYLKRLAATEPSYVWENYCCSWIKP